MRSIFILLLTTFFLAHTNLTRAVTGNTDRVVVVYNSQEPSSKSIADYYAAKRGIPQENLIGLPTSREETVSLSEFVETIYNPLLNALLEKKFIEGVKSNWPDPFGRERLSVAIQSMRYLVTIRGIPTRFEGDDSKDEPGIDQIPQPLRTNRGSVDGELALLAWKPDSPLGSLVPNPMFGIDNPSPEILQRIIKISRLDGPTENSVKRMIDRTLAAEEEGLMGRAYFDIGGPHKEGDQWIGEAYALAKAAYFDIDIERTKGVLNYSNRYDAPAIYMGWYKPNAYEQWRAKTWAVPNGAIAFHLHSYSAISVRQTERHWLGSFVNQGYCATVGNVHEPYLQYTHRPQILLQHLLKGGTFGDAVAKSNPAYSWMGIAIGDPLYQPFKVALNEQVKSDRPYFFRSYAHIRYKNQLKALAGKDVAIKYLYEQFMKTPTMAMAYELALEYESAQKFEEAIGVLGFISFIPSYDTEEYVLVSKIADLLHTLGESKQALDVYEKLINEHKLAKTLHKSLLQKGADIASSTGQSRLAQRWQQKIKLL